VAPAPTSPVGQPPQATIQRQMRVSVKASVRDPSLIVARPLADGQELPAGTREALLVLVDHPNDPLVGPPSTTASGASGAE
jgi:hypothetical protein